MALGDGSHPVYDKVGEGVAGTLQTVITVAVLAGEAIGDWFAQQTPYHMGYYVGFAVFEGVVDGMVGALTAGYGLVVTKGRHLLKLDTVMGLLQKACAKLKGKGRGLAGDFGRDQSFKHWPKGLDIGFLSQLVRRGLRLTGTIPSVEIPEEPSNPLAATTFFPKDGI